MLSQRHLNAPICCSDRKTLLYLSNNLISVQLALNANKIYSLVNLYYIILLSDIALQS